MTDRQDIKEVLERLKKAGVEPGKWEEQPERLVTSPLLTGQIDNLRKIRDLLEQMVESDRKRVATLREQIVRLEHGGGS